LCRLIYGLLSVMIWYRISDDLVENQWCSVPVHIKIKIWNILFHRLKKCSATVILTDLRIFSPEIFSPGLFTPREIQLQDYSLPDVSHTDFSPSDFFTLDYLPLVFSSPNFSPPEIHPGFFTAGYFPPVLFTLRLFTPELFFSPPKNVLLKNRAERKFGENCQQKSCHPQFFFVNRSPKLPVFVEGFTPHSLHRDWNSSQLVLGYYWLTFLNKVRKNL